MIRTPFVQKRRKKIVRTSSVFDGIVGLATSTPAINKVVQEMNIQYLKMNTDADDVMSEKYGLNLSTGKSLAKELFTSTESDVIEIANTISSNASEGCPSQTVNSFTKLIDSSAKECKSVPSESLSFHQVNDSCKNIAIHTENDYFPESAAETSVNDKSKQIILDESSAFVPNDFDKQIVRNSSAENQRNIRFVISTTMSSTLEMCPDKNDAVTPPKLVIKSGKWRRTVFEIRNKIMQCKFIHFHLVYDKNSCYSSFVDIFIFSSKEIRKL